MKRHLPNRARTRIDTDLRDLLVGSALIVITVLVLCLFLRGAILADCRHPPHRVSNLGAVIMEQTCPGWQIRQHYSEQFGWVFAGTR